MRLKLWVYALEYPGARVYVGATYGKKANKNPRARIEEHLRGTSRVRYLYGECPDFADNVVEYEYSDMARAGAEYALAMSYLSAGWVLLNHNTHFVPPPNLEYLNGRVFTPEWRAKLSVARRARVTREETRVKLSAAHRGKKQRTDWVAKRALHAQETKSVMAGRVAWG
jgi:hypothetical protein